MPTTYVPQCRLDVLTYIHWFGLYTYICMHECLCILMRLRVYVSMELSKWLFIYARQMLTLYKVTVTGSEKAQSLHSRCCLLLLLLIVAAVCLESLLQSEKMMQR